MRSALFLVWIVSGCVAEGVQNPLYPESPDAGVGLSSNDDGAAAEGDSIQGGSKDRRDPAVGLVWIRGGGFCTGTLIAPNVVLTAGHCVSDPVASFYTGEGKGAADVGRLPVAGLVKHEVIDQVAHPSYQDENQCPNSTFDVGLLRLAKPIAKVAPLSVATQPPRIGITCRAVGYGVHNGPSGQITVEQRRAATEKVLAVDDTSVQVGRKSGIVDHGDSGGPLLCGHEIFGTTSCGNDQAPSHKDAYYGRVDSIGDWIAQTVSDWK